MYTNIIVFVLVMFISMCFYKKDFWANRVTVLVILGCSLILINVITGITIRNKYDTKVDFIGKKSLQKIFLTDTLLREKATFSIKKDNEWNIEDQSIKNFAFNKKHAKIPYHIVYYKRDKEWRIGCVIREKEKITFKEYEWDNVYVGSSGQEGNSFVTSMKMKYDISDYRWIIPMIIPEIKTMTVILVPPSEFNNIPDSVKRKTPFGMPSYKLVSL